MSTLNVNKIADASGGVLAPISSVMRNRIINGAMTINQRGWTSAAVTDAFTVDRWRVLEQTDGAITAEQSTDAPAGFKHSLKITVTSTDTSLGTTQYARVQQSIEGVNISDLAFGTASAKPITISFQVKSSLTGTFSGCVRAINADRSYPFTYTISSANTWESKSVTITGDTGGSWDTSTSGGITVFLTLCSGSAYDAPAGAWETSGSSAAEGCVNVLGTNGATIQWTGVQFEVGTQATGFEYRQYGTELALCQRYYQFAGNGTSGTVLYGFPANASSTFRIAQFNMPVAMRTAPTVTYTAGGAGSFSTFYSDTNFFNALSSAGNTTSDNNIYGYKASAEL
jgi:hypothetical protein